ncbi:hypothetical protein BJ170DRAFT_207814 [Xylariales sp. AK1849]|nr:hypothetical protein BJ170DRAFT_207814 [Xylariales sp. AK1849]
MQLLKLITATMALIGAALASALQKAHRNNAETTPTMILENIATFDNAMIRDDAEILHTLGEVQAMNEKYEGDVRSEVVEGKHILIKHNTTAHIGTLAGEALDYAQKAIGVGPYVSANEGILIKGGELICHWITCLKVADCGLACRFCYMFHCI